MKNNLLEIRDAVQKFELHNGYWEEIVRDEKMGISYTEFKQDNGKNHIFIAMDENNLENMLTYAEKRSRENNNKPQDTYAIFIFKVREINEDTYKEVIAIEENEFIFKKYVFFYTDSELSSYCTAENEMSFDESIWGDRRIKDFTSLISKFVLRLVIKTPIIKLNFSPKELDSYNKILNDELATSKATLEKINELDIFIENQLKDSNMNVEKVAESLLNSLLEE
ncbi:ABC-three component system middle component 1 [Listeria seeligeri]|uniref:ABC-three component system middle component 1 n=1 Tax=Listeria seeligeri TaxID=1640 RepID=UPI0022EB18E6|nr:ABC-three component system middle component 1 [Listeria seeligeri]